MSVPNELIDRAFAASHRLHFLPLEQKLAVKLNANNIGYPPINASVRGASTVHKAAKPNQNESFFVSHDRQPEHPDVLAGKPLRRRYQWPAALPEIRADMMAYFEALWVIGIYTGREDNIFWRRLPGQDGARIEAAGAKSLGERDVEALGRDIIQTVINPMPPLTGAIHVYGGDSSFAALAANGIRKRCSNNRSTWRKNCICSNRRTPVTFGIDRSPVPGL